MRLQYNIYCIAIYYMVIIIDILLCRASTQYLFIKCFDEYLKGLRNQITITIYKTKVNLKKVNKT